MFGAYTEKVGMWLFLASDSLTFGALGRFAFSYNRIYTNPWPTPFHLSACALLNATIMTASVRCRVR